MPKLSVNNQEVEFENGMTVLQACEVAGEEIPRFCYHERLKIAGNCRMCLVEVEGGPPKPAASCAMPAAEGMKIHTNTPMVKKAREGVMEFLLMNHPLDCPICDQGGECDLQDQAMTYGCGSSRFEENKRSVKEKYMGPLIKTHMTRCIHCTRCIRFLDDVSGIHELGAVNRGEHMEISTYVEKSLTSELSGNIIDLCPVGALTSRPYAFKSRPWELKNTESIDVLDAVGSNIRVDSRGKEVLRILPRLNEDVNEEWISDKTRFACDGLKSQRLDRPYIKVKGKLKPVSWEKALQNIAENIKGIDGKEIAAIAGDLVDCESVLMLKELMEKIGSPNTDCRQDGAKIDANYRSSYLFNTTISGIEQADACLLVGTNPRWDASVLNSRIRKSVLENDLKVGYLGSDSELTYKADKLGNSLSVLEEILSGKHNFSKVLKSAKNPIIILGMSALQRKDGEAISVISREIADKYGMISKDWNGFNVLHRAGGRVGALDLGFVPAKGGKDVEAILDSANKGSIKVVYLLGADEVDTKKLEKSFVIYQGHHGDAGAHAADVILPGAAYTEKNATYVNTEGRVQQASLAIFPPGEAKEDWKIIADLAKALSLDLSCNSLEEVRSKMIEIAPHFAEINNIVVPKWEKFGKKGKLLTAKINNSIDNFYMTDSISRNSKTMAACSSDILDQQKKREVA